MTGELTKGGYNNLGLPLNDPRSVKGKPSFAKMLAMMNNNSYDLDQIIKNYTTLNTTSGSIHTFKSSITNGLRILFSNLDLILIYFVRARQTCKQLDDIISQQELNDFITQLHGTIQFFYLLQLIGTHIHFDYEMIKQLKLKESVLEDLVYEMFEFDKILVRIIQAGVDIKATVEKPTPENLQRVLTILELPSNTVTFTNYETITVTLNTKQLFCLAKPTSFPDKYWTSHDPEYSLNALVSSSSGGYSFQHFLSKLAIYHIKPSLFPQLGDCAKPYIESFQSRLQLFLQVVNTPQEKFTLTPEQKYYLNDKISQIPLILITEEEMKFKIFSFDAQEFRSIGALKLGTDIKMLATDTHEHRLEVLAFLEKYKLTHIQVVLFDDLKKSRDNKERPESPHHQEAFPKLQWLCAKEVAKNNRDKLSSMTIGFFDGKNKEMGVALFNDAKRLIEIQSKIGLN